MSALQGEGDHINELIRESELDPAEYAGVAEALAQLRAFVPEQAPVPSAELAALMSGGVVAPLAPPRGSSNSGRASRVSMAAGVAAALVLAGGVAAANNALPDPLQRFAHELSQKVLPFEFPDAGAKNDGPHQLPEPAKNDIDQGKHIGRGDGGGKTGNLGRNEGAVNGGGANANNPDKPSKPSKPEPTNSGQGPDSNAGSDGKANGADKGNQTPGATKPTDTTGDSSYTDEDGTIKPTPPGKGDSSDKRTSTQGAGKGKG